MSGCTKTTSPSAGDGGTPVNSTKPPCGCPDGKLVSLTVISNATQTNVTGAKNWATVKKSSDDVVVEATTNPNTDACWQAINWSGDTGNPGDQPNRRKLSRAASKKFHVQAELGGVSDFVDVWVIWADLEIKIGSGDTIDTGNDASGLAAGHKWPSMLGGGNSLGPISSESTGLTYAHTVGKMQAKATLSPAGIEDVVARTAWLMRRKRTDKTFDNGIVTDDSTNKDDTSDAPWLDLDPKSGSSTREIYDLDAPGCSATLSGTTVNHTAECYDNFRQWAAVTLDSELACSDEKQWSYQARVDVDKASNKVELNSLSLVHIPIPASSNYTTR